MTTYILYCYYETVDSLHNLKTFIVNGYINNDKYQYVFIINGRTCSIDLEKFMSNVTVIKRDNVGHDFGGWTEALKSLDLATVMTDSDRVIFINSTVTGPYIKDQAKGRPGWPTILTNMITDDVKLAGISINCHACPSYVKGILPDFKAVQYPLYPHVQSMVLVTDKVGLAIAYKYDIFGDTIYPKSTLVYHREVKFSLAILEEGYNINCLLSKYKGLDYRKAENHKINIHNGCSGDPWFPGAYFGENIDRYESVFFKNNRGVPMK